MIIRGCYYDGKSSTPRDVTVSLSEHGVVDIEGSGLQLSLAARDIKISPRVGSTPRRIELPDSAVCEVTDNDALDLWLASGGKHRASHFVFQLERQWSYALLALLAVGIGTWAFIQYGVPALAQRIAASLPTSMDDRLGAEVLQVMDRSLFTHTQLSAMRQQAIQDWFKSIIDELPDRQRYQLEFRSGGKLVGANAFALPSGIIVMTDELVNLAANDQELVAVLSHEVGHVANRHALRMVLQSSASALVMFGLLGDISSISSMAATVPTVLTQAKYSRAHEAEADRYAYAWMDKHGIALHYFGDILSRLDKQSGGSSDALSYFSSHPQTKERVQQNR